MSRVFVSRHLPAESLLRQGLEEKGQELVAFSLLEFEPLAFAWPQAADWLFFYSRRGVRYFMDAARPATGQRLAAMGPGTAAELAGFGLAADFIGSGHPGEVAREFLSRAEGRLVLFVQARRSRQSVQQALGAFVKTRDLVVYDNRPRRHWSDPRANILVFTSPLSAHTYLDALPIRAGQYLVAWGSSTARALSDSGHSDVFEPEAPTESALLHLLEQQVLPLCKTDS